MSEEQSRAWLSPVGSLIWLSLAAPKVFDDSPDRPTYRASVELDQHQHGAELKALRAAMEHAAEARFGSPSLAGLKKPVKPSDHREGAWIISASNARRPSVADADGNWFDFGKDADVQRLLGLTDLEPDGRIRVWALAYDVKSNKGIKLVLNSVQVGGASSVGAPVAEPFTPLAQVTAPQSAPVAQIAAPAQEVGTVDAAPAAEDGEEAMPF